MLLETIYKKKGTDMFSTSQTVSQIILCSFIYENNAILR